LAIDNAGSRTGLGFVLLAAFDVERVMDFLQRAVVAPPGEVVMHRAARRQVFRNIAPLTSSAQHVHQAVDHLTHINRPLAAAALGGRQQRPDMLPFRVGQVARVTQLVTVVERAVFGGPHAGSRGCSPAGTHRGAEPVRGIHPPPIPDSNDSQSLRTDTYANTETRIVRGRWLPTCRTNVLSYYGIA